LQGQIAAAIRRLLFRHHAPLFGTVESIALPHRHMGQTNRTCLGPKGIGLCLLAHLSGEKKK
jgi:hypothetical protein